LVTVLLVALWNPPLPWSLAGDAELLLVLDSAGPSAVAGLKEALQSLPDRPRIAVVRLAANTEPGAEAVVKDAAGLAAVLQSSDRPGRPEGSGTLAAGLTRVLQRSAVHPGTALLLVGDERPAWRDARPLLEQARRDGIPVYWWRPTTGRQSGVQLTDLLVPAHGRVGSPLPSLAVIDGHAEPGTELELWVDETPLDRVVVDTADTGRRYRSLALNLPRSGLNRVTARLRDAQGRLLGHRDAASLGEDRPSLLYVGDDPGSATAETLARGPFTLHRVTPAGFPLAAASLEPFSALILDDIGIDAMEADAWLALEAAVRRQGLGVLVLGGRSSFAAGGYRHTRFEDLLPVTAEARDRQATAAVLFVVDKSGSMARPAVGSTRLALARRAVLGAAALLEPGDSVGLISFDRVAHTVLPLAGHGDPARAIDRAWGFTAGGGTQPGSIGEQIERQLRASDAERRLLVLVSDGFIGEGVATLALGADVEPLAFAVGASQTNADALQALIGERGRVLEVGEVDHLPRLMRTELGRLRHPAALGRTRVLAVPGQSGPLGESQGDSWPSVTGYMRSTAKPGAELYLQSDNGDPLLAIQSSGLGRVAVWTPGFGDWAQDYWRWPGFGGFLGGLLAWIARPEGSLRLAARVVRRGKHRVLVVDALTADGQWRMGGAPVLTVIAADDRLQTPGMTQTAPGRFEADLATAMAGSYRATVRMGTEAVSLAWIVTDEEAAEAAGDAKAGDGTRVWLAEGLLQPWSGQGILTLPTVRDRLWSRPFALGLALLLFLVILILERVDAGSHRGPRR